ncbi:hypothetical protein TNCV_2868601 [Trichonephila clavipes]|nr:hypothetical protein TNCV_2868601 [Trichonephila clavipes]
MTFCNHMFATHATASRSHFSTRQYSSSSRRGYHKNCLCTLLPPSLARLFPDMSPIEHTWEHWGGEFVHPTSLNELEARLQIAERNVLQDII